MISLLKQLGSATFGMIQQNHDSMVSRYDQKIAFAQTDHALNMQKMDLERNLDNIRVQTLKQIQSFDTGTKQALDDMRYRYASSGISTSSGSGQRNVQYNLGMASLQRLMIQQAGSDKELELQLALVDNRYKKASNKLSLSRAMDKADYANALQLQGFMKNATTILFGA